MHTKPRRLSALVLAAVVAIVVAAVPAAGQTPPAVPQPLHHPFEKLRACLSILDLSDAQTADIKTIFEAAKPQVEVFRAKLQADRDALKSELSKTPPDPCVVGTDFLQLHADREAARTFFESVRGQVLAVLTADQKTKLAGCLEAPVSAATPSAGEAGPVE
jgi:Spy/CpxP family protein refolding chaperone